jgi:purine-binding chemotaxis protein CheW
MTDNTAVKKNIKELILFKIDNLLCGVNNSQIQEIYNKFDFTDVPRSSPHIKGILNLRGIIIPVIDLRVLFGFESIEINNDMNIIITKYNDEIVGILVDSVSDIIPVKPELLAKTPANLNIVDKNYFSGVYNSQDNLIAILNLENILSKS